MGNFNFRTALEQEFRSGLSVTENGALGYASTGDPLLDLNFQVSSMRKMEESEIIRRYMAAARLHPMLTLRWLFFARDVRGGLGERRLFRVIFKYLAEEAPDVTKKLMPLVAEYGRWDDLLVLMGTTLQSDLAEVIKAQWLEDIENLKAQKSISLMAKWLPSPRSHSIETRAKAAELIKILEIDEKTYRKALSAMRKYLNLVECKMSTKAWSEIDYKAVPSRANLIYNKAFLRNDEERRREFLGAVKKGEAKMHADTLYPHDIVYQYNGGSNPFAPILEENESLEALWSQLPNMLSDASDSILVVPDSSGSMSTKVGNTKVSAYTCAEALAVYFAERAKGQFKDTFITFSHSPQFVDLTGCRTLREKLNYARTKCEVANTNIEAVFDLILNTGIMNHLQPADMPKAVLILSDMEFDAASTSNGTQWGYYPIFGVGYRNVPQFRTPDEGLFRVLRVRFENAGYRLPKLIFWNLCSRTGTVPVKENKAGVAFVSGFSTNIMKMVLSNKLDPFEILKEQLMEPRYNPVTDILNLDQQ